MTDESRNVPAWAPPAEPAPWAAPDAANQPTAPPAGATPPAPPASAPGLIPGSQPPPPPAGGAPAPTYRSWQPGIIPLRPLSFGDFLSVPFKAMRFNRTVVLGGPLLFTLISTILVLTTTWLVVTDPQLGLLDTVPSLSGISVQTVVMIIITVAVVLLADVFSSSIIAPGVARAILGERITLAVAWRQVRKRIGSLILLYFLSAVVLIALFVVALLPVFGAAATGDGGLAWLGVTALLFLLLVLPAGMLVTIVQGVARAMIVLEGISMAAAVRRFFSLIKGRFWWTVLIVFVALALINVATSMLQYVGQFAAIAATALAPDNVAVLAIAVFVVYGSAYVVSLVVLYSYLGSLFALLYTDLRMRHEGFDLDLARAAERRAAA